MATEKLKFKLQLYATMWDRAPEVEVIVDGKTHYNDKITETEDQPKIIEFEHEFNEGDNYDLVLKRTGKINNQTIINDKGDILKDQLLHIKSIEIDEIDIGALVFEGLYKPTYPEPWATQQKKAGNELPESFKNVKQMGHNGTWTFTFASPFYMWLLENLY